MKAQIRKLKSKFETSGNKDEGTTTTTVSEVEVHVQGKAVTLHFLEPSVEHLRKTCQDVEDAMKTLMAARARANPINPELLTPVPP